MAENGENTKSDAALREEAILKFWENEKIFDKSVKAREGKKEYVFYEGPPTANGKPGIHHLEARAFKDVIPRYKTMRGYHVRRKGGWDTHGLPVELQVEKKLGLNSKKAIEEYGIAKFNQDCKESVWEYLDVWNSFTKRIGYWVDQDDPYVTYYNSYIESIWNMVKKVEGEGLLYKDYRVVPWCPRCGTALSSHELAQGYEDVKDLSVYAKFRLKVAPSKVEGKSPSTSSGQLDKYLIAWTTTPWTLPGNVALAVGKEITYVEAKVGSEILVLAKDRLSVMFEPYEIIAEHKGSEMAGMEYEPLFPYLQNTISVPEKDKLDKAYKVYEADFVNTEDGTGIVHTAVMYGQDDFVLGTRIGLPKHHLVGLDGKFLPDTGIFEGRFVRDEEVAVDIIKDLAHRGLLFKKEKYEHSYPHCWRCHTALIYYARDSWYFRMTDPKIKEKLISENKEINWEPAHIRDGRFGEWLREVKDWAISRERYWGTPLPAWECTTCKKRQVIGSISELKEKTKKSGNKYFVMRHGEAEHNAQGIYSSDRTKHHLTEKGRKEVEKTADYVKRKNISKIYTSPFLRTKETAELVAEKIGFPKEKIIIDDRLHELEFGEFSGKPVSEYWKYVEDIALKFDTKIPGGESYQEAKNRFGDFLYEVDRKHKEENILIVSHGLSVELLPGVIEGANKKRSLEIFHKNIHNRPAGLHREHEFVPLPHNNHYELDLHRPYIDEAELACGCGGKLKRTPEVMDVWIDSGAMPFAQDHYPFENKEWVEGKGYPADYICEAIDQTRGWFYTLHALGVLMGRGKAYRNVISLGHLLDAKGKKMSKSLGNVVDPWEMADKYGVDTLRLWMYSVNQPGESKNFDEKTVALLGQQVFGLLYNVIAFYELYRDKEIEANDRPKSGNILDKWILARLDELTELITKNLDDYKVLEPTRSIRDFVGDLSTWYLRRSRERIKEGDKEAKATLYFVLKTLSKLMAPFAPFAAEDIWMKLQNAGDKDSVHLEQWPKVQAGFFKFGKSDVLEKMSKAREIVSEGLKERQKAGIPVRQPLSRLKIIQEGLGSEYIEIIKDELNVKNIDYVMKAETGIFDFNITPELKEEGYYRELLRALQDLRKKSELTPSQRVILNIETDAKGRQIIEKFDLYIKKAVFASEINFRQTEGEEIKIGELTFKVKIDKI